MIFQGVPSAVHLNIIIISSSLDRAFQIKNLKLRFVRCACLDGCCVMTNDRRLVNTWPGLLKVSLVTCFIELLATRVWDVHYPHQHRPLNQPDPTGGNVQVKNRYTLPVQENTGTCPRAACFYVYNDKYVILLS